jgi:hypothetical protein
MKDHFPVAPPRKTFFQDKKTGAGAAFAFAFALRPI